MTNIRPRRGRLFIKKGGSLFPFTGRRGTPAPPPVLTPPTNVVTPPTDGWAVAISNSLDAAGVGGTYTLPRGVYELDLRTHPQNGSYFTAITIPNDRTFDFSQAELRLKPGQPRKVNGSVTSGQFSSIISNKYLGSTTPTTNRAENITVIVGCLNGNGINQGAGTATANQQDPDQSWMDGFEFRNPKNCRITGSADSPWARTVTAPHGNGATLAVEVRGVIKNVRGWNGGGGDTETFFYTFDLSRGGNVAEYLELTVDDGGVRSATGWSSNGARDGSENTILAAGLSAANPSLIHRNIWSHGLMSHGGTAWHDNYVKVQNCLTEEHNAAGFRFEYGWGHVVDNVISRNMPPVGITGTGGHNGLNLKGEPLTTSSGGVPMVTTSNLTINRVEHGVQLNSIVNGIFNGWINWDAVGGRHKIDQVDALYGNRASTFTDNFVTI